MGKRVRAWPHKRHLSKQHINQVWEFVDARAPKITADTRNAAIVTRRLDDHVTILGDGHGSEFVDDEDTAVPTRPALTKQNRSARLKPNENGDQAEEGGQENQKQRGANQIEEALQLCVA